MTALAPRRAERLLPLVFALFWSGPALAEPSPASSAPTAVTAVPASNAKIAEAHFARARQLFEENDYSLALIEFQRAYEVSPNYRVLYNIGQVEIQLLHYAAARIALEKFLEDGGSEIPPARRAQAEQDLRMLGERTAFLRVVTIPPAEVSIDDGAPAPAPFVSPLLVNAGERKVVVTRAGYLTATRVVPLAGGDRKEITVDLVAIPEAPSPVVVTSPPAPVTTRPNYVPAAIGWAATAALGIGAGIVGGIYLGKEAEIERMNDPGRDVSRKTADETSSSAQHLAITADVLGIAAIGTGIVSLYFTLRPPRVETTSTAKVRVRPSPFGLTGTF